MKARGAKALIKWSDVEKELFTLEELTSSDLRVALMTELANARHEQGISQRKLEELSGVKQPVIARMDNVSRVDENIFVLQFYLHFICDNRKTLILRRLLTAIIY